MTAGLVQHTLLTLRLNGRNRLALVYGYLIPVLFLFAFAALFRERPRLSAEMGQLLTIGVLGGACFGMPTGLVAERERGVWRRYRLLPAPTAGLVVSTMVARFVIVASSAVLQVAVAWLVFRTPLPVHPVQLIGAFFAVAFALEGLGLVIAALADTVPAVQALGQAVFLPVIIIGGVGVPLDQLPAWARTVAGFLPGRYAVEVLQRCVDSRGLGGQGFSILALLVIGAAGCCAGAKLFRWDANQRLPPARRLWAVPVLAAFVAVGLVSKAMDAGGPTARQRIAASRPSGGQPWDQLTAADLEAIPVTGLTSDDDNRVPVAPPGFISDVPEERDRLAEFRRQLDAWPLAHAGGDVAVVRTVLSVAAIADLSHDPIEGQIARAAFDTLQGEIDPDDLKRALAWVIQHPDDGEVLRTADPVGVPGPAADAAVRERVGMYATKLLGRLLGKLPDDPLHGH